MKGIFYYITKISRIEYHYFDLINGEKGDGVKNFIANNKDVISQSNNNETKYFIKGYVSHLIADENWTINVFRKIFMNEDLFPDFHQALFLDRALQIYLDTMLYSDSVNIYSYLNKFWKPLYFKRHYQNHIPKKFKVTQNILNCLVTIPMNT